jgi:hypothetical protein
MDLLARRDGRRPAVPRARRVVPVLLGSGERLFEGLGSAVAGWTCVEFAPSASVAHVRLRPAASAPISPL